MTANADWYFESSTEWGTGFALELSDKRKVHEEQTPYQLLAVYETKTFGYMMTLDNILMLTSRDNFVYHEMLAHPVLYSHPHPKRVCIIGGGDCGTLNEVLKHPEVESVIQIDIDERVTRVSEQYFPELCVNNHDPRATLAFEDGIKWMQEAPAGSLDVIIVDSTDPIGPGAVLYSQEFFQSCWRALGEQGLLAQQSESPLIHLEKLIVPLHKTMRSAGFAAIQLHHYPQVTYPSGWWSTTIASKQGVVPAARSNPESLSQSTRYYSAALHNASAILPPFLQAALAS
ncbi:MAG: polyamine aminopropyltransferase [Pseudomonadota bacterium]|jgi:spermidine synthase